MIYKYCALKLFVFLRDSGGVKWWGFVSSVALIVFLVLYTIKPIKVGEALIKWKEKNKQTADKKSVEAVIFNENHVKFFNDHINGKQCSVLFSEFCTWRLTCTKRTECFCQVLSINVELIQIYLQRFFIINWLFQFGFTCMYLYGDGHSMCLLC